MTETINPTTKSKQPPMWVLSTQHLSQNTSPAQYEVTNPEGETKLVTLSKRKRQVVDTLLTRDLFCASTVRIGDIVFRLKQDEGLFADTKRLPNGREYYTLRDAVVPLSREVAA